MTSHRLLRAGVAVGILATGSVLPGLLAQPASAAAQFTQTRTITRTHLNADGTGTDAEAPHTFGVSVSETKDLRGRQQIDVTWSGAHPSGGLLPDPNAVEARQQEYPVVLLQCRGLETPGATPAQRPSPSTCWTQTPDERFSADNNSAFPGWRLDRYAAPQERRSLVNAPSAAECTIAGQSLAERYVPFVSAGGVTYHGGPNGLCGLAPEMSTAPDPATPPANTTYGVTDADGNGSARFIVWTEQQNASLGCSATVPCVLEVVPIMGLSCDPAGVAGGVAADDIAPAGQERDAAAKACTATGQYAPGELSNGSLKGDLAVEGAMWWSASNWRNRVTVPLTFAPAANACDLLGTGTPVDLYGSELAGQAMSQWAAAFCKDPNRFWFRHIRTGEPQAKSALAAGSISAALVSRPPENDWPGPTVNAPVAVTGFAISYTIDDSSRHPYTDLKLTPRLLAKLLSESYWARPDLHAEFAAAPKDDPHSALAKNPQNLATDPEFIALNPGVGAPSQFQSAATLLSLSGNSDVMHALTSYLNADPEARAFLDGTPDPWGMVVNPAYRAIQAPQEFWPLLDTYLSPNITLDGCLLDELGTVIAVPILPLIAAPMPNLTAIAQATQYAIGNSATKCQTRFDTSGAPVGGTLKPLGRQAPGSRFMLSLTTVADAEFLGLRTAALQSDASDVGAKFANGDRRHFVAPTAAGMQGAMRLAKADDTHLWPIPYTELRTAAGAQAYPGTMVVYAAVPTTGLGTTTANHLAQLLTFAAGDGQQPGLKEGQLPPGYLPMTAQNGLGGLVADTLAAAAAVAAQRGAEPAPKLGQQPSGDYSRPPSAPGAVVHPPDAGARPSAAPSSELPQWKPGLQLAHYTRTASSALAGWAMPAVVLFGLLAAAVAAVTPTGAAMRASAQVRTRQTKLVERGSRP